VKPEIVKTRIELEKTVLDKMKELNDPLLRELPEKIH
jgi:hypothetical protein